jgi:hypothetical protein
LTFVTKNDRCERLGAEAASLIMLRDFAQVHRTQEGDPRPLYLPRPTDEADYARAAAGAGIYTSPPTRVNFPRMQIRTIERLLAAAEQGRYMRMEPYWLTLKKAKREEKPAPQRKLY